MSKFLRRLLLYLGAIFLVAGSIVLYFGEQGLMFPPPCPNVPNGCPWSAMYWEEVYVGLAMVVLGAGMIIGSRFVKEREEKKV